MRCKRRCCSCCTEGFRDRGIVLSSLQPGETVIITNVYGHGAFRKRITEMGFVKGKRVTVIKNAPLQDPVEYQIMGYNISLRRSEASMVEVVYESEAKSCVEPIFNGTIDGYSQEPSYNEKEKTISLALVGNPNCGKTTLFNYASGSHEHVGNYSGVTVDAKEAVMRKNGYQFSIVDLPGTYSITEYSPEELFVRNYILEKMPDIVVNVIDSSNLERNLYLTTQLIDMNIKVVIALNMYDELKKKGVEFDYIGLGKMIGIPIIPTTASKGEGIDSLFLRLIDVYEGHDQDVRQIHINYGRMIEWGIKSIQNELHRDKVLNSMCSTRYIAIKLIEKDKNTLFQIKGHPNFARIESISNFVIKQLENEYADNSETIITDAKYGFIDGALRETYKEQKPVHGKVRSLDDLLTHKIWGFPIFILFMWLMFQTTFTIGNYPMNWIESGVAVLRSYINDIMPGGAFRDLIVDGVVSGVGGVIVFLPNIMILFFFISLMEDTGYMARAAFIMDKLMHKIGLHGKSFIPLIMGFGCNVPAIMATRTLENKNDRLLTMIIIPFMSCNARLPVYVLLISAFFPTKQGLMLFIIYAIGIVMSVIVALFMKKIAFSKKEVPFVMELPPYRIPTFKNTSLHMWHKAQQYLKKMGTVILFASILIWTLGYFPRDVALSKKYNNQIMSIKADKTMDENEREEHVRKLKLMEESEIQEHSYIGRIGHAIEPVIEPLGFDWKLGVSIISGLAAKEIVVSTMSVLYHADVDYGDNPQDMVVGLHSQIHQSGKMKGKKVFTPLVAFGFMLFLLIYFPCVAVIAAIKKESNWGWAIFTMVYTTAMAWLIAFAVYQLGSLYGL